MDATRQAETPVVGTFTQVVRYALIAVAWLFTAGAVVQIYLAGRAAFDSPTYYADHVDFGRMIGFLAYLMPILALVGRVGVSRIMQALVIAVLFVVQSILANLDTGWVAALHALNAFLLLGASSDLGRRTLALVRNTTPRIE